MNAESSSQELGGRRRGVEVLGASIVGLEAGARAGAAVGRCRRCGRGPAGRRRRSADRRASSYGCLRGPDVGRYEDQPSARAAVDEAPGAARRMAARSSGTCSSTWLQRIRSNDASGRSMSVMSRRRSAGAWRSAVTRSTPGSRSKTGSKSGSGAKWRSRRPGSSPRARSSAIAGGGGGSGSAGRSRPSRRAAGATCGGSGRRSRGTRARRRAAAGRSTRRSHRRAA